MANNHLMSEISFLCQIPKIRKIFENDVENIKREFDFEIGLLDKKGLIVKQCDSHFETMMVNDPRLWEYIDDLHQNPVYRYRRIMEHSLNKRVLQPIEENCE